MDLQCQIARRRLDFSHNSLGICIVWIHKYADCLRFRHKFMQKFELLGLHGNGEQIYSRGIAAWMIEACDKAELDRVAGDIKHNGDR
jgi:hypothetical protein